MRNADFEGELNKSHHFSVHVDDARTMCNCSAHLLRVLKMMVMGRDGLAAWPKVIMNVIGSTLIGAQQSINKVCEDQRHVQIIAVPRSRHEMYVTLV